MTSARIEEQIASHEWWHTIEVAPGVVTRGGWDLRPTAERIPWPPSLEGLRCLDVGTFDGFWAFELERRGAAEVVAVDLPDLGAGDARHPFARTRSGKPLGETFRVAAEALGSRASYLHRDVYDLSPQDDGDFDLVFAGYVLQMVRDPLRALAAMRSVCRGWVIVLDTVSLPLSLLPAPVARLDARRPSLEFFVFNRRGLARAVELGGFRVEAVSAIIRDVPGPAVEDARLSRATRLKHGVGALGRSTAIRARAVAL